MQVWIEQLRQGLDDPAWSEASLYGGGSSGVEQVRQALAHLGPEAVAEVVPLLSDQRLLYRQTEPADDADQSISDAAASALAGWGEVGQAALAAALEVPERCQAAARALAEVGAIDLLLASSRSASAPVRAAATQTLGWDRWPYEHHRSILEALEVRLTDPDPAVCDAADYGYRAWMLRCRDKGASLQARLEVLSSLVAGRQGQRRRSLISTIGEFATSSPDLVVAQLTAEMHEAPHYLTFSAALKAIRGGHESLSPLLLGLADPAHRTTYQDALRAIAELPVHLLSQPVPLGILGRALSDEDDDTCFYAVEGLGAVAHSDPRLVWPYDEGLSRALSRSGRIPSAAADVLVSLKVGLHARLPRLFPLWADSLRHNPSNSAWLQGILGYQGDHILAFLISQLECAQLERRQLAAIGLATFRAEAHEAVPGLTRLALQDDLEAACSAASALAHIGTDMALAGLEQAALRHPETQMYLGWLQGWRAEGFVPSRDC